MYKGTDVLLYICRIVLCIVNTNLYPYKAYKIAVLYKKYIYVKKKN